MTALDEFLRFALFLLALLTIVFVALRIGAL